MNGRSFLNVSSKALYFGRRNFIQTFVTRSRHGRLRQLVRLLNPKFCFRAAIPPIVPFRVRNSHNNTFRTLERSLQAAGTDGYADTESGTSSRCAVRVSKGVTEIRVLRTYSQHNLSQVDLSAAWTGQQRFQGSRQRQALEQAAGAGRALEEVQLNRARGLTSQSVAVARAPATKVYSPSYGAHSAWVLPKYLGPT